MKLKNIPRGTRLNGLEPDTPVTVIAAEAMGDSHHRITYKTDAGALREQLVHRDQEKDLTQAPQQKTHTFDAPANPFKLAMEARRIQLAHHFDPMNFDPMTAIHAADIDPLPHQISAVYKHMLPKIPLRFVLADDPGAGKTIMTGLLISELILREDAHRILIIAPGALVDQWSAELDEKFGLKFPILHRQAPPTQNHLIARMDQLARDQDLLHRLLATEWDLIAVDEAHKMSARQSGKKRHKTKRFQLGEHLRDSARHFLLLTATPHNGIEADFNNFMSLIDQDRFHFQKDGKTTKADLKDVMHRVAKEQLVKFNGQKLFPPRLSQTVQYRLSDAESALYEQVTDYVRHQMNRADALTDKSRRGSVGFAMTSLQRRLASSPLAIWQSLARRHDKLTTRIDELSPPQNALPLPPAPFADDFDEDDWTAEERDQREQEITDGATAARTVQELKEEIRILATLKNRAKALKDAGDDRKWEELSKLLLSPDMQPQRDDPRKLIIFTEYRDTLNHLQHKLGGLLGDTTAILPIHGGLPRDQRRDHQERFWQDKNIRILLATDAAGEGVNLQVANLMVNYDMPWNPNRLEQRFGRIHRIGQTRTCRLWNMVAKNTREGDVFARLLTKIDQQKADLQEFGDRIYDILGEVFQNTPLRDLLIASIRADAADSEHTEATLNSLFDLDNLRQIAARDSLFAQSLAPDQLLHLREEMEKARARKLQPHFIAAFFHTAFAELGGTLREREPRRYEIRHVPAAIRAHPAAAAAIPAAYLRVCFDQKLAHPPAADPTTPPPPPADILHPGHPLMRAVLALTYENHRQALAAGATLVDENGAVPRLIFAIEHCIMESDADRTASQDIQFISVDETGAYVREGWAPYLDYRPLKTDEEKTRARALARAPWLAQTTEHGIIAHAADNIAAPHIARVGEQRRQTTEKERAAVHHRLQQVVAEENNGLTKAMEKAATGAAPQANVEKIRHRLNELEHRRIRRMAELDRRTSLLPQPPRITGAMLAIPPTPTATPPTSPPDAQPPQAAKKAIENRAMAAVTAIEQRLGNLVTDVSAENCGWDLTSTPPATADGTIPPSRHIEVKGRDITATTVTVTRNELLSALNQGTRYILAIVQIDGPNTKTHYLASPFTKEPEITAASINYDLKNLLKNATPQTE